MTRQILIVTGLLLPQLCQGWTPNTDSSAVSRRDALTSTATAAFGSAFLLPPNLPAFAADESQSQSVAQQYRYETRDRKMNDDAVIREDFWYTKGVSPPRKLNSPLILDDPKWNAFGSCETTGADSSATNSCTYISLKQRQPAYSKYGFSITQGAKEFQQLQDILAAGDWNQAASYVFVNPQTNLPPPTVDAQLKMVLFASSMLTSPNYSGISKELLVARFYVNEFKFAVTEIGQAIKAQDKARALAAWEFGKDSFNSYSQVVNRQIVAKVGDKFPLIE